MAYDISEGGASTAASRNAAAVGRVPHPYIEHPAAPALTPAPEAEATQEPEALDPDSGPTVAEWTAAGYPASHYPPTGYNSKSSPEEIAFMVDAEKLKEAEKAKTATAGGGGTDSNSGGGGGTETKLP